VRINTYYKTGTLANSHNISLMSSESYPSTLQSCPSSDFTPTSSPICKSTSHC
jgi:hypothetical protein